MFVPVPATRSTDDTAWIYAHSLTVRATVIFGSCDWSPVFFCCDTQSVHSDPCAIHLSHFLHEFWCVWEYPLWPYRK